jgi:hypothetical protein
MILVGGFDWMHDIGYGNLDLEEQLLELIEEFSIDELRVLMFVAERINKGRLEYGPLSINHFTKDAGAEAAEEAADLLVYAGIDYLVRRNATRSTPIGEEQHTG